MENCAVTSPSSAQAAAQKFKTGFTKYDAWRFSIGRSSETFRVGEIAQLPFGGHLERNAIGRRCLYKKSENAPCGEIFANKNSARHHLDESQAGEIRKSTASQRSAAALRASCQRSPTTRPRFGSTSRKTSL